MNKWQFFSCDEGLFEAEIQEHLKHKLDTKVLANIIELLTFTGKFREARELLINGSQQFRQTEKARAAHLRIKQYQRHSNPWLSLCLPEEKPWLEQTCKTYVMLTPQDRGTPTG